MPVSVPVLRALGGDYPSERMLAEEACRKAGLRQLCACTVACLL